jgi:HAD superfamily hydrolase (TIGR01549 family)
MHISFDFDGTIANTPKIHYQTWTCFFKQLGIKKDFSKLFPSNNRKNERFDSYPRIAQAINLSGCDPELLKKKIIRNFPELEYKNDLSLPKNIMNVKEKMVIKHLKKLNALQLENILTPSFIETVKLLKQTNIVGIISSSRENIMHFFFNKLNLNFDYIIGEESMYQNDKLYDKPHPFPAQKAAQITGESITYYIGDDKKIDKAFAENIKAKFVHHEANNIINKKIINL